LLEESGQEVILHDHCEIEPGEEIAEGCEVFNDIEGTVEYVHLYAIAKCEDEERSESKDEECFGADED
jgi:hypothetical protein